MRYGKIFSLIVLAGISIAAGAQQSTIEILQSGRKTSIRGLSVVNDHIIWASGSQGSVARSVDGGKTFTWLTVPGYEQNDFRDIEAFDAGTAIIMAITKPAAILKTTDGGKNWRKVFEDKTEGAFFDAMDFSDTQNGVLLGDPVDDMVFIAQTQDQGEHWTVLSPGRMGVSAMKGEAFFASSGTNVKSTGGGNPHFVFASGGSASRLFQGASSDFLPIMQGKSSTGANSIAVFTNRKAVVVGGDFSKDNIPSDNCVLIDLGADNKNKFRIPQTPPHGYRSCVIYLNRNQLLTCGTSGVDFSNDGGKNWERISRESYHVCQKAKKGKAVFLAGANGRIARWIRG